MNKNMILCRDLKPGYIIALMSDMVTVSWTQITADMVLVKCVGRVDLLTFDINDSVVVLFPRSAS